MTDMRAQNRRSAGARPARVSTSHAYDAVSCIVPPYLLRRIAEHGPHGEAEHARWTLVHDAAFRSARAARRAGCVGGPAAPGAGPRRTVSSAGGMPGIPVRHEGEPATGDAAADEAYDGFGATYALFLEAYGRDSIDGAGLPLDGTVHYGVGYDNAFWDGTRVVFGDGDGRLFGRFTAAVDVIGHELTHGVTQTTARLAYAGQTGALNESISDVFGVLVKQRLLGQDAAAADWLIGAGLFTAALQGMALRSMKAPGTAYDDEVLGKDPQPAHMDGYVITTEDNGGVHLNCGIPNRAFHLAATSLGGYAWQRAGAIWYAALTGPDLSPATDFAGFARATTAAAAKCFGAVEVDAVRAAWAAVGIDAEVVQAVDHGAARVRVWLVRTGGVAGLRLAAGIDTATLPEADAAEVAALVDALVAALDSGPVPAAGQGAGADRFRYNLTIDAREWTRQVSMSEGELGAEALELVRRLESRLYGSIS